MLQTQTIKTIQATLPLVEEHARTITDVFYTHLFERHPYLKNIFNMANQSSGQQSRALSDAIVQYARHIDQLDMLLPVVQRIANKHVSLGVRPRHYDAVGDCLLAAIADVLVLPDDHDALIAWAKAYQLLADVFIQTENSLVESNGQKAGGWEGFREFFIEKIVQETPNVKSFYFAPLDGEPLPDFRGGQYIGVKVRPQDSDHFQIRQYSLSTKEGFRVSVKAEDAGLVSQYLHQCDAGHPVLLQAPTGVFTWQSGRKSVFIAGGIGITPLFSMLEEAMQAGADKNDVLFIQCAQDDEHQVFKNELSELNSNHKIHYKQSFDHVSTGDHEGYLTTTVLADWLNELAFTPEQTAIYICGPSNFMSVVNRSLLTLGFEKNHIHYEVFGPTTEL